MSGSEVVGNLPGLRKFIL